MLMTDLFSSMSAHANKISLHPKTLFRGQAVSDWGLRPSFARIATESALSRAQALQLEREGINKFSISARAQFAIEQVVSLIPVAGEIDFEGWSVLMQHYSAPTRTLDWSMSPWVALYFACNSHEDSDGAVWLADFHKVDQSARRLIGDKNVREMSIDPSSDDVVYFSMAFNSHERIEAQQGRFSVSTNPLADHTELLEASGSLQKIIVPSELKGPAMVMLNSMNVNAQTLFPGADGLGRSVREFYRYWDPSSNIR